MQKKNLQIIIWDFHMQSLAKIKRLSSQNQIILKLFHKNLLKKTKKQTTTTT